MGYMLGVYVSTGLDLPGSSLMMATTRGIPPEVASLWGYKFLMSRSRSL